MKRARAKNGAGLAFLTAVLSSNTDECIWWPYGRKTDGYGATLFRGKIVGAHKAECILAHGEPPTSKHMAAHSCGSGHLGCVNPRHLHWATNRENIIEYREHIDAGKAKAHRQGKLTLNAVRQIIDARGKEPLLATAARFGVSESMVSRVQNGSRWERAQNSACVKP